MNPVAQYLRDAQTFYLATTENGIPHVRPFGAVVEWEGKTYLCTANNKDVYRQITANPQIAISCMVEGTWLRLSGKLNLDPRREAKAAFLQALPDLQRLYSVDDGIFEVLYLSDVTAHVCSFTEAPKPLSL
ncbi:MAG: pyridoxamine 5'-phosphate oxidase family protein [Firmicutes bacterium]|nr:pyridoxamine 5'-phosphate oxidase family protein [Bacillota bacterium]